MHGLTPTPPLPRRAVEALLVCECVRGSISRGKVAEVLGLPFYEAESLFLRYKVPYPIKGSFDDALANASWSNRGPVEAP